MAKKTTTPPQSAEDAELATELITASLAKTIVSRQQELAAARIEMTSAEERLAQAERNHTAWVEHGQLTEDEAVTADLFAHRDMEALARQVTSPSTRLDADEVASARRKHGVVRRYLTDRGLLPAALTGADRQRRR